VRREFTWPGYRRLSGSGSRKLLIGTKENAPGRSKIKSRGTGAIGFAREDLPYLKVKEGKNATP